MSPDLHECTPYEATVMDDTIIGAFTGLNSEHPGSFSVPDDVGGGYVEFSLSTVDSQLAPA